MGYEIGVIHPIVRKYLSDAYPGRWFNHPALPNGKVPDFIAIPNPNLAYIIECKATYEEMERSIWQVLDYAREFRLWNRKETIPILVFPIGDRKFNKMMNRCLDEGILGWPVDDIKGVML